MASVRAIEVYGMNWNGDSSMHADFKNTSIVPRCCTKCTIHATASQAYGAVAAVTALGVIVGVCVLGVAVCVARRVFAPREERRPLLALKI